MKCYVGVSGFSYPGWRGSFYPEGAKSEEFLGLYSSRLQSVEINSSFYAQPGAAMVKSWSERTGDGFRFSVKAPKQITHIAKLGKGAEEGAQRLAKVLHPLGDKRGPVLFQLPPFLKVDLDTLRKFLEATAGMAPRVFEFRHESWLNDETFSLLESHGAGFCVADTEDMAPVHRVTGELSYFRLRKDSYDLSSIQRWAKDIRKTGADSKVCYAYLRHDETGVNAGLAAKLQAMLSD